MTVQHASTRTEPDEAQSPFVDCPECGLPAYVEWRTEMESTDGPVEHVKIRCLDRHWFFMMADGLT